MEKKYCSGCKQELPLSEFWRVRKDEPELQKRCKSCMTKSHKKYYRKNLKDRREHGRKYYKRTKTAEKTEAEKKYQREYQLKRYYENKDMYRAHDAVQEALERWEKMLAGDLRSHCKQGKFLIRPERCQICGNKPRRIVQAHHARDYKQENWLDVIWVCEDCHEGIHIEANLIKTENPDNENYLLDGLREFLRKRHLDLENAPDDIGGVIEES